MSDCWSMDVETLDLGSGFTLRFFGWAPDRKLNPGLDHLPDEERSGAIISHQRADGQPCEGGSIAFDTHAMRNASTTFKALWSVMRREPLTLEPSITCSCGEHGWIHEGIWVSE